jgi:hypothetical protein
MSQYRYSQKTMLIGLPLSGMKMKDNILHICPRIIALRSKDKNDSSGISGARNQNANTIPVPMTM